MKNHGWVLSVALLVTACGSSPLEKLRRTQAQLAPARSPSVADFKTLDPQLIGNQYKFLFIVDESGSNLNGGVGGPFGGGGGGGGTDPDGTRRFDNLVAFIDKQIDANAPASYGFIAFGDGAYLVQDFTDDPQAFRAKVLMEKAGRRDNEGTNFVTALARANGVISADAERCKENENGVPSFYVVFHISDGVPSPAQSDGDIKAQIDSMLNLSSGANANCVNGVILHTGYYHNGAADPTLPEAVLMSKMATWGKGQFIDFSDKTQIDLSRYRIPQLQIQMRLVDVMVANMSTVWEDGTLKLDTDNDGLSDELEARLGSDPRVKDSDGNGVTDYVERYLYRVPCNDKKCRTDKALDFVSQCGDLRKSAEGETPVVFRDTDKGGFNDCEKRLLGGRLDRWDSNGNSIPDCMEFFRGMNFISGAHQENADPFNNGIPNREKLKRGMPIDIDARTITTFKPYDYLLRETGRDDRGINYSVEIRNIPVIGANNTVRVYLFESTLGVKDLRFMRIAEKQISSSTSGVEFKDSDFGRPVRFECTKNDPCF